MHPQPQLCQLIPCNGSNGQRRWCRTTLVFQHRLPSITTTDAAENYPTEDQKQKAPQCQHHRSTCRDDHRSLRRCMWPRQYREGFTVKSGSSGGGIYQQFKTFQHSFTNHPFQNCSKNFRWCSPQAPDQNDVSHQCQLPDNETEQNEPPQGESHNSDYHV